MVAICSPIYWWYAFAGETLYVKFLIGQVVFELILQSEINVDFLTKDLYFLAVFLWLKGDDCGENPHKYALCHRRA